MLPNVVGGPDGLASRLLTRIAASIYEHIP
jgi:hypothetical protein